MNNQPIEEQITNAMRNIPEPNPAKESAARAAFLAEARQMREYPYPVWQRPHSRKWMIAAAILMFLIGGFALSVQNMRQSDADATVQAEIISTKNNPSLHQDITPTPSQAQIGVSPITADNAAQLVELQRFGTGTMNGAVWSPDGKQLAVYGPVGVWFYDADNFEAEPRFFESEYAINDADYSPDGSLFATATSDGAINLFETITGTPRMKVEIHKGQTLQVTFSPDGQTIASASDEDKSVRVWSVKTGRELIVYNNFFSGTSNIRELHYSPDGKRLAASGMSVTHPGSSSSSIRHSILIWDVEQKYFTASVLGANDAISDFAYSADGKHIATGSWDKNIYIWNTEEGLREPRMTLSLNDKSNQVNSVDYSPNGNILASSYFGGQVQLWNSASGEPLETLQLNSDDQSISFTNPVGLKFSPDGQKLAVWDLNGPVVIWNISTAGDSQVANILDDFDDAFVELVLSSADAMVAVGTRNSQILVWDTQSGDFIGKWKPQEQNPILHDVEFVPNSSLLTITYESEGEGFVFWDPINSNAETPNLEIDSFNQDAYSMGYRAANVAFNQDATQMVSAGAFLEDLLTLWDIPSGKQKWSLKNMPSSGFFVPLDLIFSADNRTVISLQAENRTFIVWDSAYPEEYHLVEGHSGPMTAIAITADGTMLASLDREQTLILWDTATWQEAAYIRNIGGNNALAFSQNGELLAVSGYDGEIYLWNINTQSLVTTLHGHATQVTDLVFTHDGTRLISSSFDGTVRVWGLQ